MRGSGKERKGGEIHTEFPAPNFFSVPTTAPERWAAFRAAFPRTTVSRAVPPPWDLLPILVTESQSSMMIDLCVKGLKVEVDCICGKEDLSTIVE
jgi:hypothetical protein